MKAPMTRDREDKADEPMRASGTKDKEKPKALQCPVRSSGISPGQFARQH